MRVVVGTPGVLAFMTWIPGSEANDADTGHVWGTPGLVVLLWLTVTVLAVAWRGVCADGSFRL